MKVYQAGFSSVVALMGSSLPDVQAELIGANFRGAVLMLDGDAAGAEATPKIAAQLLQRLFVRVVHVPAGSQPGKLSSSDINRLLLY